MKQILIILEETEAKLCRYDKQESISPRVGLEPISSGAELEVRKKKFYHLVLEITSVVVH